MGKDCLDTSLYYNGYEFMRGCIPVITALNIWHYDSPAAIFNGFWLVSICLWKFFGIYPDFAIGCGVWKRKHSLSEISMKRDFPPVSREVWNIVKGVTNTIQKDNQDQFCDCRWKNLHKQNISQFRSRKLTGNILGGKACILNLFAHLLILADWVDEKSGKHHLCNSDF